MKKSFFSLIIILLLLMAQKPAWAQYVLKEADAQFELFNYIKAIDLYEQGYKKKATLHAAERLGECYELVNNYKQTESWYAIAAGTAGSSPENILHYAKALQNNSKYAEAKIQYQKYSDQNKAVTAVQQRIWSLSCDSAMQWMQRPTTTRIDNQKGLNSGQSDWGAVQSNGQVVFASDRGNTLVDLEKQGRPFLKFDGAKLPDKNVYGWTGNHYLRLYSQHIGKDSLAMFPLVAGTDYHVGPASFTGDGKVMFFTLTRIPKKPEYVNGKLATVHIEIFSSKQGAQGKWLSPVGFPYNNANEYSVGDPYLSKGGDSLYFVSNMPGGKGGTDIYLSLRLADGTWGKPLNLNAINTEGNERTPSIGTGGTLYFSSDGRIGMGGLDVFSAEIVNGKISEPKNLGYPVNSPQDDFAYVFSSVTTGYLASNRTEGLGDDDIYSFIEKQIIAFELIGKVYDKNTRQVLNNAIVTLGKVNGGFLKVQTDEDGKFSFNLDETSDYNLTGEKTNYRSDAATLTTKNLTTSTTINRDLYLEAIVLDKAIRLENIYYDFDKSNIRPAGAVELDKVVKIMQDNPTIWIELGSHTDSRGNDQYNQWLSQSRANSAVQYIIDRGIEKNRITAKGYGESQLLNRCGNGVKCSEADHQLNRRTEFKIVKY